MLTFYKKWIALIVFLCLSILGKSQFHQHLEAQDIDQLNIETLLEYFDLNYNKKSSKIASYASLIDSLLETQANLSKASEKLNQSLDFYINGLKLIEEGLLDKKENIASDSIVLQFLEKHHKRELFKGWQLLVYGLIYQKEKYVDWGFPNALLLVKKDQAIPSYLIKWLGDSTISIPRRGMGHYFVCRFFSRNRHNSKKWLPYIHQTVIFLDKHKNELKGYNFTDFYPVLDKYKNKSDYNLFNSTIYDLKRFGHSLRGIVRDTSDKTLHLAPVKEFMATNFITKDGSFNDDMAFCFQEYLKDSVLIRSKRKDVDLRRLLFFASFYCTSSCKPAFWRGLESYHLNKLTRLGDTSYLFIKARLETAKIYESPALHLIRGDTVFHTKMQELNSKILHLDGKDNIWKVYQIYLGYRYSKITRKYLLLFQEKASQVLKNELGLIFKFEFIKKQSYYNLINNETLQASYQTLLSNDSLFYVKDTIYIPTGNRDIVRYYDPVTFEDDKQFVIGKLPTPSLYHLVTKSFIQNLKMYKDYPNYQEIASSAIRKIIHFESQKGSPDEYIMLCWTLAQLRVATPPLFNTNDYHQYLYNLVMFAAKVKDKQLLELIRYELLRATIRWNLNV